MQELVEGMDLCGMPLVGLALHMAAAAAARRAERYANGMGYAAMLTLLVVLGWGFAEVGIFEARSILAVAVLAWVAATSSALAALLIQPPALALWNGWKDAIRAHRAEVRRYTERMAAKKALAALPPLPPPAPPPSKEQLLAEAEAAYREELRLIDLLLLPEEEKGQVKARAERKYLEQVANLMGMS